VISSLCHLRGLFSVPPPKRWKADVIVWILFRVSKAVPVGKPLFGAIELRDNIVVPQQHPVERTGGSDLIFARFRKNDQLDDLVNDGILDADRILRAALVSSRRPPIFALLIAGGLALCPDIGDNIKFKIHNAILVLA
jgi:hypothetical protein